ncbi:hypothetical protein GGQ91_003483 [Methylobacterium fujisawaense]|uniref:Uncharacterized protein n=1 Tax=Methylobacterium fujisawaense TaxID=107400 RepID=A0ABR6DDC4_9HYPH|nr:hypothetical protein [Methylobacterium fujisawaense]
MLGSGLLDDVPLDDLARLFDRIGLVDAVHPWPARLAARRYPNVALVTAEISAGLAGSWADLCTSADLIVSANLLSQLPIVPIEAHEARGRAAPSLLRAHLVETHLKALDTLAGRVERVCLITDAVQRAEDRSGRFTDSLDMLFGSELPPTEAAWDWELGPFGASGRRHRLIHRVQACPDWKTVPR